MIILYIGILWCLIVDVLQPGGYAQELGKSQANSYFYLKQNGGYEYAFNTDTGLQTAQTADQSNEVTGHYMYYDKGIPFMVKYRAGIHGFQPEIVPAEQLTNFIQPNQQTFEAPGNSRDIRTSSQLQDINQNNYRLPSPKVSSYSIGQDSTLNFVQNALHTMQTQPMHISFSSGLGGEIQHPAYTTTIRPPLAPQPAPPPPPPPPPPSTLLQPVLQNEVQDINNLAVLPPPNIEPRQPYSFNYNADQSARSESGDPSGNVMGSYSYYDEAGYHDISYKASDDTGFVVLGGNLAHNQPPPPPPPPAASIQHQQEFLQPQPQNPYSPHSFQQHQHSQPQRRQLFRNNNFNFNNYRILPDSRLISNALDERNLGKRSLRSTNALDEQRNLGKRSLSTKPVEVERKKTDGIRSLRKFRRYAKW